MKISIFGLGYVGCVGIGCFAKQGHYMIGVDVSEQKVGMINSGRPTIVEKDIDELIESGWKAGLIHATTDFKVAVNDTDISFLCVGTPTSDSGHLDLSYIYQTAEQIGEALREKEGFHIIVIRSTVFPGTNDRVCGIVEQYSGRKRNIDFAVVSNPEFLREGSAVKDFLCPPMTVVGSDCERAVEVMKTLYAPMNAPFEHVAIGVAEMIKYVNNSFHALKVVFANEVGSICKAVGVDSHELMRIFCMDTKLNISPYYLMSGFAYGGSCLPKDLRGLCAIARDNDLDVPVLDSIAPSNCSLIKNVAEMISETGKRKVGVLGISFKAGTDDVRNSPILEVIRHLLQEGDSVSIYDKNVPASSPAAEKLAVSLSQGLGRRPAFFDSVESVCDWAEVIIIANKDKSYASLSWASGKEVYDLVRIPDLEGRPGYHGLWW